jgi:glutamate-1-semialdehyde 2,1-aminomutase
MQEELGIIPDMTTLGKYIGGGMSFGAFGGRADLMGRYDPRRPDALPHAGTFNNNILTMSAGVAGMSEIFTREAARELSARGEELRRRLNKLGSARVMPIQFTGIGSLMGVHFSPKTVRTPQDSAEGHQALKELFFFDMLERGIYFARRGMLILSLPVGAAECDRLVEAVEDFLTARAPLLKAEMASAA